MASKINKMWSGKRKKKEINTKTSNKKAKVTENVKMSKSSVKDDKLVKAVVSTSSTKKCEFCKLSRPPELTLLGSNELYSMGSIFIHYFCILFSTEGEQKGEDEEGLLGFLLPSVKSELARGKKLNCSFCKKSGATISCKARGCKTTFHFPCGVKSGCLYQFAGSFTSYCPTHRASQARSKTNISTDLDCVVCFEPVASLVSDTGRLSCPGCGRNFHSPCLQRMALASGSQCFKCPHCNNSDKFLAGMRMTGVYVPDKDADWEGEENSSFYNYGDLYRQAKKCAASDCTASNREEHKLGTKWEIILCDFCGLNGIHIECEGLDIHKPDFSCWDCKEPLDKLARQDKVTCLAYNVDDCVIKLGRLPENTPSCVVKAGQKGKKELFSRISSKVRKYKDNEGVVLVSCVNCEFTVPWLFLQHMEHHLDNCRKDEDSLSFKYPAFVSVSRDDSLGKTSYKCNKCVKVFDYQTWFEKHLKIVHEWQNIRKPSPPPVTVAQDPSESEDESDGDSSSSSSSSEDDETIRKFIKQSQSSKPGGSNSTRKLYNPSEKFDLTELELNLTMAQFAKNDKYQLVVFIGDVSQEERNVVFKLWKHLDNQIATGNSFKCLQCAKYFAERWQLSSHLSTSCTLLFDDFFNIILPSFEKLKMVPEFHFYREKVFSFLDQEYCLLCGRTQLAKNTLSLVDTPVKRNTEQGSLQNHLINFHLKKQLLLDSGSEAPVYSCKFPNCNSTFPSCPTFLQHLAETHGRVTQLLQECTSLSNLPGTQPVKDYANPFTQERYKCKVCSKKAISKASLMIHMVEHNMVSQDMGLKCSQENCDFKMRFSDMAVTRHFGVKHLQLELSSAEVVDVDSSSSDDSDDEEDFVAEVVSKLPVSIKILESCSIDVSQFDNSSSSIPKPEEESPISKPESAISIPAKSKREVDRSLKPIPLPKETLIVILDSSDEDDDMPIIKFKRVPIPLKGSYVCPFCTSGYREEATLLAHLVSSHFREKLAFMVPGEESPFACPKIDCTFRHRTREGVGDHLGRRHREVVVTLVRQIFPDFSFSKHNDTGDTRKVINVDTDIIIDDEIVVLGESSHVKNSEFVSCEVVSELRPKQEQRLSEAAVKARARPVVLPSGSGLVGLANSPHARIAPMVQQNKVRPMMVKKVE